jgi:hypothetical protein
MAWKSAYERAVESLAEGERLRQARLDAIGRPPPDPWGPDFYGNIYGDGGRRMNGPQDTTPAYKDAYTRACEALAEMDHRRLARANGEPLPAPSMETAQRLADRLVDPNRPQPKPARDPRLGASAYVLANRAMGRPDDYGDDADG